VTPLQATVSTVLLSNVNRPEVDRAQVMVLLQYLKRPMSGVQVKELRDAYRAYQNSGDVNGLIEAGLRMRDAYGVASDESGTTRSEPLSKEHLRLVCFDMVSG